MTMHIEYFGKKPNYKEHLYGSKSVWTPGEVKPCTDELGKLLLGHPDIFRLGKGPAAEQVGDMIAAASPVKDPSPMVPTKKDTPTEPVEGEAKDPAAPLAAKAKEEAPLETTVLDIDQTNLQTMRKDEIVRYAHARFNEDVSAMKINDMRKHVRQLRGQLGVPQG